MNALLRPFFAEGGGVPAASPALLVNFDDRKGFFDLSEGFFEDGKVGPQGGGKPPELADNAVGTGNSICSVCIICSIHRLGAV